MKKEIWFDMDGTIADLYGVQGWLDDILNERADAYTNAKPLINMQVLARTLNALHRNGYSINIVSWLARGASDSYNQKVATAKRKWLRRHLASVEFTSIDIITYGTPKNIGRNGILFDDEIQNRNSWNGLAFDEKDIITILRSL